MNTLHYTDDKIGVKLDWKLQGVLPLLPVEHNSHDWLIQWFFGQRWNSPWRCNFMGTFEHLLPNEASFCYFNNT